MVSSGELGGILLRHEHESVLRQPYQDPVFPSRLRYRVGSPVPRRPWPPRDTVPPAEAQQFLALPSRADDVNLRQVRLQAAPKHRNVRHRRHFDHHQRAHRQQERHQRHRIRAALLQQENLPPGSIPARRIQIHGIRPESRQRLLPVRRLKANIESVIIHIPDSQRPEITTHCFKQRSIPLVKPHPR